MKKFKNDVYYTNWRNQIIQLSPNVIDKIVHDYERSYQIVHEFAPFLFFVFALGFLSATLFF